MSSVHTRIHRPVAEGAAVRPAVFLDRDGVIVEETGYLHRVEDTRFIAGSLEAIAALNRLGIPVVLVTNQSGIGRGYYGWPEYEQVQAHIEAALSAQGAWLDAAWACGAHPDSGDSFRKPNPGMLHAAAAALALNLGASWMVGDKLIDVQAALRAGIRGAIHVLSGHGKEVRGAVTAWAAENSGRSFRVEFADTLADAVSRFETRFQFG
jgi:D-glycero-D-manno-heptose 1,7-bisphosphate phosphatase